MKRILIETLQWDLVAESNFNGSKEMCYYAKCCSANNCQEDYVNGR